MQEFIQKKKAQDQNIGASVKSSATLPDNRPQNSMQLQTQLPGQSHQPVRQSKNNSDGLPAQLQSGIEKLSGYSMDDVKVHYHSDKPSLLQAHAYAQGLDIHLASGQEKHLPHEAWHVVQQKQGRVKPTTQLKGKVNINDDKALEQEADTMGNKALSMPAVNQMTAAIVASSNSNVLQKKGERTAVASTRLTTRSAGEGIRRGNRRASIVDTGGRSAAKLAITYNAPHQALSTGYRNKVHELIAYVIKKMVDSHRYTQSEADHLILNNLSFLQAKAVEEISVGNCGEFSMVVFAHLAQNTTDQYIYRARMNGLIPNSTARYDHAFVFTSPQLKKVTPDVTDVQGFNKTSATIADAWDGYQVMTLAQFMDGGNAYKTQLTDNNVVIIERAAAKEKQIFDPEIRQFITDWAVRFNHEFERQMKIPGSTYRTVAGQNALNPYGFETRGSTDVVGIDDKRTFVQKYENSTEREKPKIVADATNPELLAYLISINTQGKAILISWLSDPKFKDFFDYLNEAGKELLVNLLPENRILTLYNGGNAAVREFVVNHVSDRNLLAFLQHFSDAGKEIIINFLPEGKVSTLYNGGDAHLQILIIRHLAFNKMRDLFYSSADAGKKRLINSLTTEELFTFFEQRSPDGKREIALKLEYHKIPGLFYRTNEVNQRFLISYLTDPEVIQLYNESYKADRQIIKKVLAASRIRILP